MSPVLYFEKCVLFLVVIFQILMLKDLLVGSLEDANLLVLTRNMTDKDRSLKDQ